MVFTDPGAGTPWCDRGLLLRTLQIPEKVWDSVIEEYRRVQPTSDSLPVERVRALSRAYAPRSPHACTLPRGLPAQSCPVCASSDLQALVARRPGSLVWALCLQCGHGSLLQNSRARESVYTEARYYQSRDALGVGYDDYGKEARYRQEKGARLVECLRKKTGEPLRSLLEVGSGYGYTRVAAEAVGVRSAGVDLNPHAAAEAASRYGLATWVGDLEGALSNDRSGIARAEWDVVVYQFVLEHIEDLQRELRLASRALRPRGWLSILVPSVEATELEVFGASYRSLRADHLHLFSAASIERLLQPLGFAGITIESGCNLHLLRGFCSPAELVELYASGRGPDLFVLAQKTS